jgi:hypothetical protein
VTSLPTWLLVVLVWLFGCLVVVPACLVALAKYNRWVRRRGLQRARGGGREIEWAPEAARGRSRRPVPPAVDRRAKGSGRPLDEGTGRVQTNSRSQEEAWRE